MKLTYFVGPYDLLNHRTLRPTPMTIEGMCLFAVMSHCNAFIIAMSQQILFILGFWCHWSVFTEIPFDTYCLILLLITSFFAYSRSRLRWLQSFFEHALMYSVVAFYRVMQLC